MNLEEQLKVKEEQLKKVGEEINQLQGTIAQKSYYGSYRTSSNYF